MTDDPSREPVAEPDDEETPEDGEGAVEEEPPEAPEA